jgi:hypothetical protein
MFFDKKNRKAKKCESCGSKTEERYSFCPYCGNSFIDLLKEKKDFGLIGRSDSEMEQDPFTMQGLGITDKLIGSLMNSVMKNLDKQFKDQFKEIDRDFDGAEIKSLPNGIRIKVAGPVAQRPKPNIRSRRQEITEDQIKKMSSLPRSKAKTNVKRLGNKVVYELLTPGVESPHDVFVSKLESGYEVKAIGNKKIYVNSIPITLPIIKYSILNNKLLVEFQSHEN